MGKAPSSCITEWKKREIFIIFFESTEPFGRIKQKKSLLGVTPRDNTSVTVTGPT